MLICILWVHIINSHCGSLAVLTNLLRIHSGAKLAGDVRATSCRILDAGAHHPLPSLDHSGSVLTPSIGANIYILKTVKTAECFTVSAEPGNRLGAGFMPLDEAAENAEPVDDLPLAAHTLSVKIVDG
jgi:hypothetical protein